MSRTGCIVLALSIALNRITAQTAGKQLLEETLHELDRELPLNRGGSEVEWLQRAAERWKPTQPDEGQDLRKSLQLMVREIRRARNEGKPVGDLLIAVSDDLKIKVEHCRAQGLTAGQKVEVRTKRDGIEEVKGLEVWYIEKFLALDPAADSHRFGGFSSPVGGTFVPGRYSFWVRNPINGRSGEKVEQRVSGGTLSQTNKTLIELLAP